MRMIVQGRFIEARQSKSRPAGPARFIFALRAAVFSAKSEKKLLRGTDGLQWFGYGSPAAYQ